MGGEQRKCPAWLIYAWCEEGDKVAWVKQDFKMTMKREYDKNHLAWWFTQEYNKGKGVGTGWAASRGNLAGIRKAKGRKPNESNILGLLGAMGINWLMMYNDIKCQRFLATVGTEHLTKLQAKIVAGLSESSIGLGNAGVSQAQQSPLTEPKATAQVSITSPPKQPAQPMPTIAFQPKAAQSTIQQPPLSQITTHSTVFQPAPPTTTILSYSEQVEKISKGIQDKINPEELKALFKWVTEGHLLEVEKLLKKNPTLTLGTGTVKDLSDRTFTNITVLQYAAWALDSEMCELIMQYAEAHNSSIQLKALAEEPAYYSPHGASYDFTPLVTKTKTYVNNCAKWDYEKCCQYWQKEVGGEQRKCPAWLIYAWSEEGADVAWTKQDVNRKINREYDKHRLVWWFTQNFNNGRGVGSAWAVWRCDEIGCVCRRMIDPYDKLGFWRNSISHDLKCVTDYATTRRETLQRLRANANSQLNQVNTTATIATNVTSKSLTPY